MDNNRLHYGTYEILLEFDAFGDLNPETAKRIREFLRTMKGQARTSAIAKLTLTFDEDSLDRRWMRKTENKTRDTLRELGANWEEIEEMQRAARHRAVDRNAQTIGDILEDIHHGITPSPERAINYIGDKQ